MAEEGKVYNRIKAVLAERKSADMWLAGKDHKSKTELFGFTKVLDADVRDLLVSTK